MSAPSPGSGAPVALDVRVAGVTTRLAGPGPHHLGRDAAASVTVSDLRVSRLHGVVEHRGDRWWYRDMSRRGTFHDGAAVTEAPLDGPTLLRLGSVDGPTVELDPGTPDSSPTPGPPTTAAPLPPPGSAPQRSEVVIGRDPGCDLVLSDLQVSRRHALLRAVDPTSWELVDLGSANGTHIDGERIERCVLRPGARVRIGSSSLTFDGEELRATTDADVPVLSVRGVRVEVPGGRCLLASVDLAARSGTLTAIVGPSGAGKSTLLRVLTGQLPPTAGEVRVLGDDLYRHYEHLRTHIGYVPQDDIVVPQLSAEQCLELGAALRFPEEVDAADRSRRVRDVLASLGLTAHAGTTVSRLSGGQRKRVSVAMELLNEPDLLLLDEPTTGLDPGYEQATMELLRHLADSGRTVVVVTHAVASLDLCDQVVFLGSGGWVGFAGPAESALKAFEVQGFPELFRLLEQPPPPFPTSDPPAPSSQQVGTAPDPDAEIPYPNGFRHQIRTLVRRQLAMLRADPRVIAVLLLASIVPAILLAGLTGGGSLDPAGSGSSDARMLVGALVVSIGVIGVANGVREIVKELPMYRRERAAGLRRSAYLTSKLLVFGAITTVQAAVLVGIGTARAGSLSWGLVLPGRLELTFVLAATGIASLTIGLLVSAVVSTSEKAVTAIPLLFVVLWLFSGSVSNLAEKPVLREVALLSPSNWGMAASSATVSLLDLSPCPSDQALDAAPPAVPPAVSCDARWRRTPFNWVLSLTMLAFLGGAAFLATDVALAHKEPLEHMRRQHLLRAAVRALGRPTSRSR